MSALDRNATPCPATTQPRAVHQVSANAPIIKGQRSRVVHHSLSAFPPSHSLVVRAIQVVSSPRAPSTCARIYARRKPLRFTHSLTHATTLRRKSWTLNKTPSQVTYKQVRQYRCTSPRQERRSQSSRAESQVSEDGIVDFLRGSICNDDEGRRINRTTNQTYKSYTDKLHGGQHRAALERCPGDEPEEAMELARNLGGRFLVRRLSWRRSLGPH